MNLVDIDFREVFKEIKEQYSEYINSPKIFGSIVQNNPSIIIKKEGDKWVKKIYNFAFGGVYISVRMYNVIYTIEMQNESQIKSFLLSEYEDDTLKKTKRSISATPKYKKRSDEYGQYDHRYLFIRYISEDCSIDIDDISINEEKLINFINSVVNGNLNDLYNKMFT